MTILPLFKELGLSDQTLLALKEKGFEEPTPIQRSVIPLLLGETCDVVGQARTGTGKTAAFALPMIERIDPTVRGVQGLVLVPTRELALQVSEEIISLKGSRSLQVLPIYGGAPIFEQIKRLKRGVQLVVGTPGRILDLLERRELKLDMVTTLVLDEADEMLNMGFIDDVETITAATPKERRMLLFSATMPDPILQLARRRMGKYQLIREESKDLTTELTEQIYFEVRESDKFEALCRIIDVSENFYALIFCRTKVDVDQVSRKLLDRGYTADLLHGDITQRERERVMERFKAKKNTILVATDVAARGLDVNNLSHVINYSLPHDPESYVHRIGRTGRAGSEGTAITFVTPDEYRRLLFIKRIARTEIRREKLPGVSEVLQVNMQRVKSEIQGMLAVTADPQSLKLARELLMENSAEEVVSTLIGRSYGELFRSDRYREIEDISYRRKEMVNAEGRTRLFIALGRSHGHTARSIVTLLAQKSGVAENAIQGLKLFETFSFITVPFEDAEKLLRFFKGDKEKKPLVTRARAEDGGHGDRDHKKPHGKRPDFKPAFKRKKKA